MGRRVCRRQCPAERFGITADEDTFVVALAGNPNVGKSTVFNALTGMHQHTGNWAGKTVVGAQGRFDWLGERFVLVDLPGTYSLRARRAEEATTRDFICFGSPDAVVVVVDASCMERNLFLLLQVLELTDKVILCVNLIDEAKASGVTVDLIRLEELLRLPVVGTSARRKEGLYELRNILVRTCCENEMRRPRQNRYSPVVEAAIGELLPYAKCAAGGRVEARWLAMRALEGDEACVREVEHIVSSCGKGGGIREG